MLFRSYKLVIVGDASMSPHEIVMRGGSVEHYNDEPGTAWMGRLTRHFRKSAWINPMPEGSWGWSQSTGLLSELMEGRMYPMSLEGLERMTRALVR